MPQLAQAGAIYASQLFWLAIVFGLIYFGIGRAMVPRIERTIDDRNARVAADLAAAEAARVTVRSSQEGYDAALDSARAQATRLVGDAKARAAASVEQALKAGNASQEQMLADAMARIEASRGAALGEIENATVDAVEAIVAKLSGTAPARATVEAKVKAELANG